VVLVTQPSLIAQGSNDDENIRKALKNVTALELPAKASSLVAAADEKDREAVALTVIKVALRLHPSAAPAIVGAIIRTTPSVASSVVATATKNRTRRSSSKELLR
jgi:hypothetical protein